MICSMNSYHSYGRQVTIGDGLISIVGPVYSFLFYRFNFYLPLAIGFYFVNFFC